MATKDKNPWQHVRAPDVSKNPYIHPATPPPPPPPPGDAGADAGGSSASLDGQYILMPQTTTYALGVEALRESYRKGECPNQPTILLAGNTLVRPLTFKENITARVEDFHRLKHADGSDRTLEDRLRFFDKWLDACTGIGYQAGTTKFKIVPVCEPLITIASDFGETHLDTPYHSLPGIELDRSHGKYGTSLTPVEIENHAGWRTALEGEVPLLTQYRDIVFAALQERNPTKTKPEKAMAFHVQTGHTTDELRALFVGSLINYSGAVGGSLSNIGSFLRVAPRP